MKIIDVRLRPPFRPYLGEGNMFDIEINHPFALNCFYKNFGCKLSPSMQEASLEKLIKEMNSLGDFTGVVSIRKNAQGFDNEALLDLIKAYPKKFLGAPGLPIDDSKKAVEILDKLVVNGPCITAFMEPGFAGTMIDDPKLDPVYNYAQENKIPLLISYGGFHGPNDEYQKPIYAQNVAQKYPDLKICLCHACWPWVVPAVWLAFRCPNIYLSPDIYALHSAGAQDYIEAANYMLRDKILYGSAYPCVDLESSVKQYVDKLRPEVAENIMWKNAAKFLNLPE